MRTVLVVDDDEQLRGVVKLILLDSGYAVLEAANGGEVSALYDQHHPDLVITDLLMPDKEGLEVIMELNRSDHHARIIAMSGGGRINAESYLLLANKLGVRRTLTKPFTPDQLLEAVRLELGSEV